MKRLLTQALVAILLCLLHVLPVAAKDWVGTDAVVLAQRDPQGDELVVDIQIESVECLIALDIPLSFGQPKDPVELVRVEFSSSLNAWDIKHALIDNVEKTVLLGCLSSLTGKWDEVNLPTSTSGAATIASLVFKNCGGIPPQIVPIERSEPSRSLTFMFDDKGAGGMSKGVEIKPDFKSTPVQESLSDGSDLAYSSNFPNPFNPSTTIRYTLEVDAAVTLEVFNLLGQRVRTLVNSSYQQSGDYEIPWDGTNESGASVGSGTYFYRLNIDGMVTARKMIMLK